MLSTQLAYIEDAESRKRGERSTPDIFQVSTFGCQTENMMPDRRTRKAFLLRRWKMMRLPEISKTGVTKPRSTINDTYSHLTTFWILTFFSFVNEFRFVNRSFSIKRITSSLYGLSKQHRITSCGHSTHCITIYGTSHRIRWPIITHMSALNYFSFIDWRTKSQGNGIPICHPWLATAAEDTRTASAATWHLCDKSRRARSITAARQKWHVEEAVASSKEHGVQRNSTEDNRSLLCRRWTLPA